MTPQLAVVVRAADAERRRDFASAVRDEQRRLYVAALAILHDAAEAEDAVQDTWMQAWRRWDSLRQQDRRAQWLMTICVRRCFRQRSRLRRWLLERPQSPAPDATSFAASSLDLHRAQEKLSPQQRAAVFLTYHHGYTVDECAHLMGVAPGTARSHLARALTTLRKEMRDD